MDNSNNLSSAKTVAGENTTEKENEQIGSSQVINKENNSTNMEETNHQSSMAPQAGACETTLGSGVKEAATVSENESATEAQVLTMVHNKNTTGQELPAPSLNATLTNVLTPEEEMTRLLSWEKLFYSNNTLLSTKNCGRLKIK